MRHVVAPIGVLATVLGHQAYAAASHIYVRLLLLLPIVVLFHHLANARQIFASTSLSLVWCSSRILLVIERECAAEVLADDDVVVVHQR